MDCALIGARLTWNGDILVDYCHHPREAHDMGKTKFHINPSEIRRMYVQGQMSLSEIASRFGCTKQNIRFHMLKHGVEVRSQRDGYTRSVRRKMAAARSSQFSPMANPFIFGCPSVRTGGRRVRLYRLIAEAVLGRQLMPSETVHHCNNCQADNRPANLWVFPSRSAHSLYHRTGDIHADTIRLVPYCGDI